VKHQTAFSITALVERDIGQWIDQCDVDVMREVLDPKAVEAMQMVVRTGGDFTLRVGNVRSRMKLGLPINALPEDIDAMRQMADPKFDALVEEIEAYKPKDMGLGNKRLAMLSALLLMNPQAVTDDEFEFVKGCGRPALVEMATERQGGNAVQALEPRIIAANIRLRHRLPIPWAKEFADTIETTLAKYPMGVQPQSEASIRAFIEQLRSHDA